MDVVGRVSGVVFRRGGPIAPTFGRLHAKVYARYGGRRFTSLMGVPVFRLVVTGRKSGEPRPVMLIRTRRGDDLVVCGSNGGHPATPPWWLNLEAAGEATVELDGTSWPVKLRVVEDSAERDELWKLLCRTYPHFPIYQDKSVRRFPIGVLERMA